MTANGTYQGVRPPLDPTLFNSAAAARAMSQIDWTVEDLRATRTTLTANDILKQHPKLMHTEYTFQNRSGRDLIVSVFAPRTPSSHRLPAFFHIHGGGLILGDRFTFFPFVMKWLASLEMVIVTVEYGLAPEHPAPAALHDSYDGLMWLRDHADELGVDDSAILLCGISGGGGPAVGCAMLCRDEDSLKPLGVVLVAPMLDDRLSTNSAQQFADNSVWHGGMIGLAWKQVLGDMCGKDGVSPYVAPARAMDLMSLPPMYLEVGECEIFRDETVALASGLWRCGVSAELHVWKGVCHAFEALDEGSQVVEDTRVAKLSWLRRLLAEKKERDAQIAPATM